MTPISSPAQYSKGDRVAQLVVHQVTQVHPVRVDHLGHTARGTNGHGSTGA